jgi:GNAT superfamily N-acetyltransferase
MAFANLDLIRRSHLIERDYFARRAQIAADTASDPCDIYIERIGEILFTCAKSSEMAKFNCVMGLCEASSQNVEIFRNRLETVITPPRIEVVPGLFDFAWATVLDNLGYRHSDFHSMLIAHASEFRAYNADDVSVTRVNRGMLGSFQDCYASAWGVSNITGLKKRISSWLEEDCWILYLASVGVEAAGIAVLCLKDDIAYLADAAVSPKYRGRGIHRALISARVEMAIGAGARYIIGQAPFLSISHANMCFCGLNLMATKSIWRHRARRYLFRM